MDLPQICEQGDAYNLEKCEHNRESCIEQPLYAVKVQHYKKLQMTKNIETQK